MKNAEYKEREVMQLVKPVSWNSLFNQEKDTGTVQLRL